MYIYVRAILSGVCFFWLIKLGMLTSLLFVSDNKPIFCLCFCRYYFAGSKEGTVEFFVQNLPSWPDNLSPSLSGGYWVGSAIIRSPVTEYISDHLIFIRSIMAKVTPVSVHVCK